MQIRRFDLEPHNYSEPKGQVRSTTEQSVGGASGVEGSGGERSTFRTTGRDSRWTELVERFQSSPLVRVGAVEAAKAKLARGEFGTREAAERLANTELKQEFFTHRP